MVKKLHYIGKCTFSVHSELMGLELETRVKTPSPSLYNASLHLLVADGVSPKCKALMSTLQRNDKNCQFTGKMHLSANPIHGCVKRYVYAVITELA